MRYATRTSRIAPRRRGNTIVLVSAVLVLLVIIATGFVTRTQAGRQTSSAVADAQDRDAKARHVADFLAGELALQLFPSPLPLALDPPPWSLGEIASANHRRLSPLSPLVNAPRYGAADVNLDGVPDHPYNFAPFNVVPWTNWPDIGFAGFAPGDPLLVARLPGGPGNPGGGTAVEVRTEGNPLGNPGSGDTRGLSDLEPLRYESRVLDPDFRYLDAYSHWRHLTYLARADNAVRLITDISDVFDSGGDQLGLLLANLDLPVEQWLPLQPSMGGNPIHRADTGDVNLALLPLTGNQSLADRFGQRFFNYAATFANPELIPPNFLKLSDLDGDGITHEFGERPQDEFDLDTPRGQVSRFLADTDGDGYTDSFWFLLPTPVEGGIRQMVAARIVDNSGKLNLSVATQFDRFTTTGATPSDLALVGDSAEDFGYPTNNFNNVGLFDNHAHHEAYRYHPFGALYGDTYMAWYGDDEPGDWFNNHQWARYLDALGAGPSSTAAGDTVFRSAFNRRAWWQGAGRRSLNPDFVVLEQPDNTPGNPLDSTVTVWPTTFGLGDEMELAMFNGQNYAWIASRLEKALQTDITDQGSPDPASSWSWQILHGNVFRQETSEYPLDFSFPEPRSMQLANRELVYDLRSKVTLYNGARNDLIPPWLQWRYELPEFDVNGDGIVDGRILPGTPAAANFLSQSQRKLDLREPDGLIGHGFQNGIGSFADRLPRTLALALSDGPGSLFAYNGLNYQFGSYVGTYTYENHGNANWALRDVQKLAAAYAANILTYRDPDSEASLRLPQFGGQGIVPPEIGGPDENMGQLPADPDTRFLGMELQPFLLEAFVGHVYASQKLPLHPLALPDNHPWQLFGNPGNFVDNSHEQSTVVAVQIANPFDRPLALKGLGLRVFGQLYELPAVQLRPATESRPRTAIFYAIAPGFDHDHGSVGLLPDVTGYPPGTGFLARWLDYFDLEEADQPALDPGGNGIAPEAPFLYDVNANGAFWSTTRNTYQGWSPGGAERAIELVRFDVNDDMTTPAVVVIDRFDHAEGHPDENEFYNAVHGLAKPPPTQVPEWVMPGDPPGEKSVKAGWRIGDSDTLVLWGRVTRAWGKDFNFDGAQPEPATFGIQPTERAPRFAFGAQQVTVGDTPFKGDQHNPGYNAGADDATGSGMKVLDEPDSPWFDAEWDFTRRAPVAPKPRRKPTCFNNHPVFFPTLDEDKYPAFDDPVLGYGNYYWYYDGVNYALGQIPVNSAAIPDKGYYGGSNNTPGVYPNIAFQMLQKDGDFQQVGELLNVWLYGHELAMSGALYSHTRRTFSETTGKFVGNDQRINRLRPDPKGTLGRVIGAPKSALPGSPEYFAYITDFRHATPALPAGLRVLDAFVCDGRGQMRDFDGNGVVGDAFDVSMWNAQAYLNADGFGGGPTAGLVNLNTAPIEVLRSLPHLWKLVHAFAVPGAGAPPFVQQNPRLGLAEAIIQYRERFPQDQIDIPTLPLLDRPLAMIEGGAGYYSRNSVATNLREARGFASIGEINLLDEPAGLAMAGTTGLAPDEVLIADAWRVDAPSLGLFPDPLIAGNPAGQAQVSTDVNPTYDDLGNPQHDWVAGDVEEMNLLFAGLSNMVTTRSDAFTVYFRVRSFRQNPVTRVWNALDQEQIVDDSRYVMLVDRSAVSAPTDRPRILYLEKMPK
jgi:hypothetical protein